MTTRNSTSETDPKILHLDWITECCTLVSHEPTLGSDPEPGHLDISGYICCSGIITDSESQDHVRQCLSHCSQNIAPSVI